VVQTSAAPRIIVAVTGGGAALPARWRELLQLPAGFGWQGKRVIFGCLPDSGG
jgi:hypothetical protein